MDGLLVVKKQWWFDEGLQEPSQSFIKPPRDNNWIKIIDITGTQHGLTSEIIKLKQFKSFLFYFFC